eukprot:8004931-Alexandrium_andersonii.AAC.1
MRGDWRPANLSHQARDVAPHRLEEGDERALGAPLEDHLVGAEGAQPLGDCPCARSGLPDPCAAPPN